MNIKKSAFFCCAFILAFSFTVYSKELNTEYVKKNTIWAIYANGEKFYKYLMETFINGLLSENKAEQAQMMEAVSKWITIGAESLKGKSSSEIASILKEWDKSGYCIPNGALKFAYYDDKSTYLSLEAKSDLKQLYENTKQYASNDGLTSKIDDSCVIFTAKNGFETKFTTSEIIQGKIPENVSTPDKPWKIFKLAKNDDVFVLSEVNFDLLNQQEQKAENKIEWIESIPIIKAIHPIYRKFSKGRLILRKDQTLIMAAYKNEQIRQEHKLALTNMLDEFGDAEKQLMKQAKDKKLDDKIKLNMTMRVIDNAPWLGLEMGSITDLNTYATLFPIVMVREIGDFKRILDVEKASRFRAISTDNPPKSLGWRELFNKKQINPDKNILIAMQAFDKLEKYQDELIKKDEFEAEPERIDELSEYIKCFNDNMPWDFIKSFEWDEGKHIGEKHLNTIFKRSTRTNLGYLITNVAEKCKKNNPDVNCSFALSAVLKIYLMFDYSSQTVDGRSLASESLFNCYFYYDGIQEGLFSAKEMKDMLNVFNEFEKYRLTYAAYLKNIIKNYGDPFMLVSYQYVPVSALFGHFKSGSPYLTNEKAVAEYEKFEFRKGDDITMDYETISQNPYAAPGLISTGKHLSNTESRMFLIKAWLENKLGLPLTATDPYTGKLLKHISAENGEPEKYCYKNIYSFSSEDYVSYFDTLGKSKEKREEIQKKAKERREARKKKKLAEEQQSNE